MLEFEFDAALFQLEHDEPQFEPLSQLPPPMAAPSFPACPLLLFLIPLFVDPLHTGIDHPADCVQSALCFFCAGSAEPNG